MNKKYFCILQTFMMVAMVSMGVASCGDDEESVPDVPPVETVNPDSPVWGEWEGSGTTLADKHATLTLKLYSDGTGALVASTSGVIVVRHIVDYSYDPPHHISMVFQEDPTDRIWVWVESLTSTTMQLVLTDLNQAVQGEYNLTKTGSGDRGASGGSETTIEKDEVVSTKALVILKLNATNSYSHSEKTCYKKVADGKVTLYSNSSCTNLIGVASRNSDSERGPYKVSSYSYRVIDPGTGYSYYYYFD